MYGTEPAALSLDQFEYCALTLSVYSLKPLVTLILSQAVLRALMQGLWSGGPEALLIKIPQPNSERHGLRPLRSTTSLAAVQSPVTFDERPIAAILRCTCCRPVGPSAAEMTNILRMIRARVHAYHLHYHLVNIRRCIDFERVIDRYNR